MEIADNCPEKKVMPYASNAAGPLGTPKPRKKLLRKVVLPLTLGVTATGAVVLSIMSTSVNRCRGATRSARIAWDQRQEEVDRAIAEQSHQNGSTETPHA